MSCIFFYKYRDYLHAENIAIISPNKVFSDYISTVLPQLGEEPINELNFEDIVREQLNKDIKFEKYNEVVENDEESTVEVIKFKATSKFVDLLDDYIKYVDSKYFSPQEVVYKNILIDKDFILEKYNAYKRHPMFKRLEKISNDLIEKINMDTRNIIDINKKEIYKQVKDMFKLNTTLEIYKDFYKYINKDKCLILKNKKELEYYDVFPYIYLQNYTEGIKEITNIHHVLEL